MKQVVAPSSGSGSRSHHGGQQCDPGSGPTSTGASRPPRRRCRSIEHRAPSHADGAGLRSGGQTEFFNQLLAANGEPRSARCARISSRLGIGFSYFPLHGRIEDCQSAIREFSPCVYMRVSLAYAAIETGSFRYQQAFKSSLRPPARTLHDHWRNFPGFFSWRGFTAQISFRIIAAPSTTG